MRDCCEDKAQEIEALGSRQRQVLILVLAINAAMFLVEFLAGLWARSAALMADSLDMLGDATVYGFSLYALSRGDVWKERAALLKGMIMAGFGLGVLLEVLHRVSEPLLPLSLPMFAVGAMALGANGICLWLLSRHREDDINMKSTWICSRNDIIANSGVLGAAILVLAFESRWPDIVVGGVIALVFLLSAFGVIRESWSRLGVSGGRGSP